MVEGKGTGIETFGLGLEALEQIRGIFSCHAEIRCVKIFGPRVTLHFERHSDIDLALWGDLNAKLLGRILTELDELPLPYTFDVTVYDGITNPKLKKIIDETGKILYSAS